MGLHFQFHPALFDFCNRQKVLHQILQPCRIIINVFVHLPFYPGIQLLSVRQKDAGIAGDGGQRGPQVMGNGTQQGCPELLVLRTEGGFLLFPGIAAVFQCQGAIAQNGQQNAVFKGFQRLVSLHDHGTIHLLLAFDGITQGILSIAGSDTRKDRDCSAQKLCYLGPSSLEDLIVIGCLLQHLAGLKQQISAVGRLSRLFDLTL